MTYGELNLFVLCFVFFSTRVVVRNKQTQKKKKNRIWSFLF